MVELTSQCFRTNIVNDDCGINIFDISFLYHNDIKSAISHYTKRELQHFSAKLQICSPPNFVKNEKEKKQKEKKRQNITPFHVNIAYSYVVTFLNINVFLQVKP